MTPLRWAVALTIAVLSALWLHALVTAPAAVILTAPSGPQLVQQCQDPGRAWCGATGGTPDRTETTSGDTFSIERYAPDGHYRDDGSIPLAGQGAW